jgi:hypothetical protein
LLTRCLQSKIFILSKQEIYPTLSKYIDPEHIPEQYGGKLKYKFGDLPNMDPAMSKILQWTAPNKRNGSDTIPEGPIRLKNTDSGQRVAIAVGTENGKQRDCKVAIVHTPSQTSSAGRPVNGVEQNGLGRTTSGEHTHPPSPPSGQDISTSQDPEAPLPGATSTLPVHPHHMTESTQTSTNQVGTDRTGTSGTSYTAQSQTLAHGTLAAGTPDKREGTFGEHYRVNEPNTIGQAPKEHAMPEPEQPTVTYVNQAKQVAEQAYETAAGVGASALAAVGYGSVEQNKEEQAPRKTEDPRVDAAGDGSVEEYLRSKYESPIARKAKEEEVDA